MSHSKSVYVLNKGHLIRFQNIREAYCTRCLVNFKENDIIATSTSKRYCYECATQVNLVTGKVSIDLHNDEFILDVSHQIKSIGKRAHVGEYVCKLAILLITTAIENANFISKNKTGLACAALFTACTIKNHFVMGDSLPISKKTLQKNMYLLQKNLTTTDVHRLSTKIHEIMQ